MAGFCSEVKKSVPMMTLKAAKTVPAAKSIPALELFPATKVEAAAAKVQQTDFYKLNPSRTGF